VPMHVLCTYMCVASNYATDEVAFVVSHGIYRDKARREFGASADPRRESENSSRGGNSRAATSVHRFATTNVLPHFDCTYLLVIRYRRAGRFISKHFFRAEIPRVVTVQQAE